MKTLTIKRRPRGLYLGKTITATCSCPAPGRHVDITGRVVYIRPRALDCELHGGAKLGILGALE